uniref:Uncharacterized protein n=1 Tax=Oryza barthii TaxID=65489 RepID=A0A0D3GNR7_9ORYZ
MSAITTKLLVLDDAAAGASKAAPGTGEARATPDPRHRRRPPRSTSSSPPREEGPDASAGGTGERERERERERSAAADGEYERLEQSLVVEGKEERRAFMVWPYDPRAILMLESNEGKGNYLLIVLIHMLAVRKNSYHEGLRHDEL